MRLKIVLLLVGRNSSFLRPPALQFLLLQLSFGNLDLNLFFCLFVGLVQVLADCVVNTEVFDSEISRLLVARDSLVVLNEPKSQELYSIP